jgi:hypothetical protein
LVIQALRNFEAIHRVRPVEILGHEFGFVALYGADAVPDQRAMKALQRHDFVNAFLDVVFAKVTLTASGHATHIVGAEGFGHGQQLRAASRAAAGSAGRSDAGLHSLQLVAQDVCESSVSGVHVGLL